MTVGGGTATYCISGYLLHEFIPAGDMLNVAEAVIRVFHRLGDYQHKARNRMKFLIKELGWEGWRAAFEVGATRGSAPRAARACHSIPMRRRSRRRPIGRARRRRTSGRLRVARGAARAVAGPGIVPQVRPSLSVAAEATLRWLPHERAPAEAGRICDRHGDRAARRHHRRADARARASSRSPTATVRSASPPTRTWSFAGCRPARSRRCTRGWRRPASSLPDAGTIADVTSCPGAESCRLAVTQSRGLGKLLGDHLREHPRSGRRRAGPAHQDQRLPERLRPAPRRRHRVPGQHPQDRWTAGAAVLRHGRAGRGPRGATVRPAGGEDAGRRVPEALERLLASTPRARRPARRRPHSSGGSSCRV